MTLANVRAHAVPIMPSPNIAKAMNENTMLRATAITFSTEAIIVRSNVSRIGPIVTPNVPTSVPIEIIINGKVASAYVVPANRRIIG